MQPGKGCIILCNELNPNIVFIRIIRHSSSITSYFMIASSKVRTQSTKALGLPSLKLTNRPWKLMVGIRSFPFWGPAYFQGRTVSFREGITILSIKSENQHPIFPISITLARFCFFLRSPFLLEASNVGSVVGVVKRGLTFWLVQRISSRGRDTSLKAEPSWSC